MFGHSIQTISAYMRSISLSDAKNELSALVREVRGGAAIVITDRGIPVAQLMPVGRATGVPSAAIELAQKGRLLLPMSEPTTAWRDLPSGQLEGSASAVAMLLAERHDSPRLRAWRR